MSENDSGDLLPLFYHTVGGIKLQDRQIKSLITEKSSGKCDTWDTPLYEVTAIDEDNCPALDVSDFLEASQRVMVRPAKEKDIFLAVLGGTNSNIAKNVLKDHSSKTQVKPSTVKAIDRSYVEFAFERPKAIAKPVTKLLELGFMAIKPIETDPGSLTEKSYFIKSGNIEKNKQTIIDVYKEFGYEAKVKIYRHCTIGRKGQEPSTSQIEDQICLRSKVKNEDDFIRIQVFIIELEDLRIPKHEFLASRTSEDKFIRLVGQKGVSITRAQLRDYIKTIAQAEIYRNGIDRYNRARVI
jgi:hypothetical protein